METKELLGSRRVSNSSHNWKNMHELRKVLCLPTSIAFCKFWFGIIGNQYFFNSDDFKDIRKENEYDKMLEDIKNKIKEY